MSCRAALLLLIGAAITAPPAGAQDPVIPVPAAGDTTRPTDAPWLLSYYPYVGGGAGGGPVLLARIRYFQPSPWQDRVTHRAELWAEAGIGLHGSRLARAAFNAPLLAPGWRTAIELEARRNTRANFFGLGNDTERSDARVEADEFAYRVARTTWRARGDLSRQLAGPAWVSLALHASADDYAALSSSSVFASEVGDALSEDDLGARAALVLDTRDVEFDPTSGILAEVGVGMGTGGDGYERLYGIVRGYLSPREGTVLAARVGASDFTGDPPLSARLELPAWERGLAVYGGGGTNRGLDGERLVGTGVLFGNVEVRQDLFWIMNAVGVTLVGFVDAGRVFEGERLRLTTDDLATSGGGGLVVRLLRNNMVGFYLAGGPDGAMFSVGGGWAF